MLVCRYHLSRWIFVLLICYLQFWDPVSSDPHPAIPPTPSLTQASSVGNTILGAVVLVCQAPEGPGGTLFRLHRVKKLVDSITFPSERQEARFTVRVKEDSAREDIYCCLYQNSQGMYSSYSHYMTLKQQASPRALPPPPPPPPPLLSVDPPGGLVKRGQTLSFHCSPPPPHSQQSPKPEAFLLLWTAKATGDSVVYPQASLASRSTAQTGAFRLGPVRGGEGGSYTCLYQVTVPCQGPTNSTASHPVLVTVTELLPVPTLSLQRQAGEWALVCTGSPAFPGARFSLYQLGSSFPDATRSAPVTRHRALFALSSLPAQDGPLSDQYQCQYSALLGAEWSHSERSPPLAVSRVIEKTTTSPPSSPGLTGVDWPLVVGSLSALVLVITAMVGMGVAVQRKVKAMAEEKRKREGALLWAKLHSGDHVLDLTLKRVSITSQEWGNDDRAAETAFSRSPPWRTPSTFGNTPSS
ncbi:uncharacterized protein LOC121554013 isoform X2 [Coregonus clupeaformis]|uniref:uncharacterized protein LOC121554013 isoform X2 n=1 Tax=Coregonus clupeaformis TaxID=59861 RepID=UPI001BE0DC83|nr:uncharacterized protein LOC121554013 isoform X2 [Coregonus clupeaformis]